MIIHLRFSPPRRGNPEIRQRRTGLFVKPMADSKNTVPRVRRQAGAGRQELSA